jgi:integrase
VARNLISSDASIRSIKGGDPRKRLNDGDGLYLLLFVKGGAHGWRLDYSHEGRRKTLSLGTYPDTSLQLARRKADDFRKLLAAGIDPSDTRKSARAQREADEEARIADRKRAESGESLPGTFKAVALDWFENFHRPKVSEGHAARTLTRFQRDVFPFLADVPLAELGPPSGAGNAKAREEGVRRILGVLLRVEERGAIETAHRIRDACNSVFKRGIQTGYCDSNPAEAVKARLQEPKVDHLGAITEPKRVGELLRAIDFYTGQPVTRAALRFAALVFQRPGNVRGAKWAEIDLEAATWTIPSDAMKRTVKDKRDGKPHLVPLSRQAVELLRELHPLTCHSALVFPGTRGDDKPMSDATLNAALRRLDFAASEMTSHGFRAMARTMLHERLGVDPHVIEAQLAHQVPDALGRAYNRTQFREQRIEMMQQWADYLDKLRQGAAVIPLSTKTRAGRSAGKAA